MSEIVKIGNATLYRGDSMEIMPSLDAVNAIITDPPYSDRTHKGHAATASGSPSDFGSDNSERKALGYASLNAQDVDSISQQFNNLCTGWIVWMTDHHLAAYIQKSLEDLERYVFAPLPFYAPGSRTRLVGDGPASWTIWIMVSRTKKQYRWGTLPGGYVAGPGWRDITYMGGKPVQLMDRLLNDYSKPGDVVLDPFLGGGTTGVSCANLGRRFIGIEQKKDAFDLACERIEAAYSQGDLFRVTDDE